MNEEGPNLEELAGDVESGERERLAAVHELLLRVGPPPELSPQLSAAPAPPRRASVVPLPRRYRYTAIAAAAMLVPALFGAGYLLGNAGDDRQAAFTVAMSGSGSARAELDVFARDAAGNWPMELTAHGLRPLAGDQRYELWLTRGGRLAASCGVFSVSRSGDTVTLNAPYDLRAYDGWVVVVQGTTQPVLRTHTL